MPSGRTHDLITYILSMFIIPFVFIINGININSILFITSFLFSALMFNGDLDIINSRPFNRWWLLKMIWIPYQMFFSHRSIWTHGFIIGTLIRVIYIAAIPTILFYNDIVGIVNLYNNEIIIVIIGLEIGSMSHSIADKIFNQLK